MRNSDSERYKSAAAITYDTGSDSAVSAGELLISFKNYIVLNFIVIVFNARLECLTVLGMVKLSDRAFNLDRLTFIGALVYSLTFARAGCRSGIGREVLKSDFFSRFTAPYAGTGELKHFFTFYIYYLSGVSVLMIFSHRKLIVNTLLANGAVVCFKALRLAGRSYSVNYLLVCGIILSSLCGSGSCIAEAGVRLFVNNCVSRLGMSNLYLNRYKTSAVIADVVALYGHAVSTSNGRAFRDVYESAVLTIGVGVAALVVSVIVNAYNSIVCNSFAVKVVTYCRKFNKPRERLLGVFCRVSVLNDLVIVAVSSRSSNRHSVCAFSCERRKLLGNGLTASVALAGKSSGLR